MLLKKIKHNKQKYYSINICNKDIHIYNKEIEKLRQLRFEFSTKYLPMYVLNKKFFQNHHNLVEVWLAIKNVIGMMKIINFRMSVCQSARKLRYVYEILHTSLALQDRCLGDRLSGDHKTIYSKTTKVLNSATNRDKKKIII